MANEIQLIEANMDLLDPGTASALTRIEIMQQVATAKSFPRNLDLFKNETKALATESEEMALECIYALPRSGKKIEGPSIRFAEIIMHSWRNARAGARVIHVGDEFLVAQGVFQDFERNVTTTQERQRRIVDSEGKRYGVDMIGVTANAAGSIALREAILRGVPKPFWQPAMDAARSLIAGDTRSIGERRDRAFHRFELLGAKPELVLAYLGYNAGSQINGEDIVRLRALAVAIGDGDTTIEQAFGKFMPRPKTDIGEKLRNGKKNGEDHNAETKPKASVEAKPDDRMPPSVLEELRTALAETTSRNEVEAVADSFADQFSAATGENATAMRGAISEALERFLTKSRKKSAAAEAL